MTTYEATVTKDGKFWLIHVEGVGATQARNLGEVRAMGDDLVVSMTDLDPTDFSVTYKIDAEFLNPEPGSPRLTSLIFDDEA